MIKKKQSDAKTSTSHKIFPKKKEKLEQKTKNYF